MSNFYCDKCGKVILDSPDGYTTGCEHYPLEEKNILSPNGKGRVSHEELKEIDKEFKQAQTCQACENEKDLLIKNVEHTCGRSNQSDNFINKILDNWKDNFIKQYSEILPGVLAMVIVDIDFLLIQAKRQAKEELKSEIRDKIINWEKELGGLKTKDGSYVNLTYLLGKINK